MKENITAIVLAGGKSSRMKTNKALLKIGNLSIINILVEKLDLLFNSVIIISNFPDEYTETGKIIYKDIYPFLGPVAGIHSGLFHSNTENNFIISCDMPLITIEAIKYLQNFPSEKDAVLYALHGNLQILCGIYKKRVYILAEQFLIKYKNIKNSKNKINLKLFDLIKALNVDIINIDNLKFYNENLFFNMNTEKDYNYIIEMLEIKNKTKI
ncbi:MAG: molybdenum cofactor guanylyltransferase [Bacteroidetes bacterium]|nr:molybdenum cofactor guanylyltransferase [Bacteroidota bacterium]